MTLPVLLADISWNTAPLLATPLAAALLTALAVVIAASTIVTYLRGVPARWVVGLGLLRAVAWGVFLLILLQPTLLREAPAEPTADLMLLVDVSQSMAQPSGTAGRDRLHERLDALAGDLGRALRDRYRVTTFPFDQRARRGGESEWKSLEATGPTTHIARAAAGAWDALRAEDRTPRRVLLISDGQDQGAEDVLAVARGWGVPVDVLAPSAATPPLAPAWSIADIQVARRVLLGSETHFRVTLRAEPAPAGERKIRLHLAEDGKTLTTQALVWPAGQTERAVVFAHRPTAAGAREFGFTLDSPEKAGIATGSRTVQVVDGKFEILVLEDSWRWEYKHLHRLFEDDPSLRFTALLARGSRGFAQFGSPDRRVNLIGFPQSRAEVEGFDFFLVGDVDPARWPRGLAGSLASLVSQEGRSLVVIAGPNLAKLGEVPELHALLPVDLTPQSGTPVAGPVDVRLQPEAASSPFFFQVGGAVEQLPPLDQVYPVLRKRPGATVLLEAAKQRNNYGPLIVMAEHTVGKGRVLFVGTDTLWKWHTLSERDGPSPYAIFWQQALRTLAPARSAPGSVQVWLTPSRSQGTALRTMTIDVEVQSDRPLPAGKLEAFAVTPGGQRRPLPLSPDPAQPWIARGDWLPQEPGAHQLLASYTAEGRTVAENGTIVQIEPPARETPDSGIDEPSLRRLAAGTGGQWVDADRPDTWPPAISSDTEASPRHVAFDPWGSFTLLIVLCVVLGIDWFLRVFQGLT